MTQREAVGVLQHNLLVSQEQLTLRTFHVGGLRVVFLRNLSLTRFAGNEDLKLLKVKITITVDIVVSFYWLKLVDEKQVFF
jgi:hypothetical protein